MNETFDMSHFVTVSIFQYHNNKFLALIVVSELFHSETTVYFFSGGGVPQSGLFAQVIEVRLIDRYVYWRHSNMSYMYVVSAVSLRVIDELVNN
jgi:hypothetical protein